MQAESSNRNVVARSQHELKRDHKEENFWASPQSSESKIRRRNSSTTSTVRHVSVSDFSRWSLADIHSCSDLADIGKKAIIVGTVFSADDTVRLTQVSRNGQLINRKVFSIMMEDTSGAMQVTGWDAKGEELERFVTELEKTKKETWLQIRQVVVSNQKHSKPEICKVRCIHLVDDTRTKGKAKGLQTSEASDTIDMLAGSELKLVEEPEPFTHLSSMPSVCQFELLEGVKGPLRFHLSGVVVSVGAAEITSYGKSQQHIKMTDMRGHAISLRQQGSGAEVDDIHVHDKLLLCFLNLQLGVANERDGAIWLYEDSMVKKEGSVAVFPTISKEICFPVC